MSTNSTNTESNTELTPTPTPEVKPTEEAMPVPPKAGELDDLGYTVPDEVEPIVIEPADEEVPPADEEVPPNDEVTPDDETPAEDVSGYGKENEVKPEDIKPVEKTEAELAEEKKIEENKTPEEKAADELAKVSKENIEKSIKTLPENFDQALVSKFVEENGFTDKQVEAYVKLETEAHASLATARAEAVKVQRAAWSAELRADVVFGGENFDKNVDRVNKVIDKYLPETKKVLTERGSMLPPSTMKDFLSLDKVLNPKAKLPIGEPPAVKKAEVNLLDEMYG